MYAELYRYSMLDVGRQNFNGWRTVPYLLRRARCELDNVHLATVTARRDGNYPPRTCTARCASWTFAISPHTSGFGHV